MACNGDDDDDVTVLFVICCVFCLFGSIVWCASPRLSRGCSFKEARWDTYISPAARMQEHRVVYDDTRIYMHPSFSIVSTDPDNSLFAPDFCVFGQSRHDPRVYCLHFQRPKHSPLVDSSTHSHLSTAFHPSLSRTVSPSSLVPLPLVQLSNSTAAP